MQMIVDLVILEEKKNQLSPKMGTDSPGVLVGSVGIYEVLFHQRWPQKTLREIA